VTTGAPASVGAFHKRVNEKSHVWRLGSTHDHYDTGAVYHVFWRYLMKRVCCLVVLVSTMGFIPSVFAYGTWTTCSSTTCWKFVCNGVWIYPASPPPEFSTGNAGGALEACGIAASGASYKYRYKIYPWVTLPSGLRVTQVAMQMQDTVTCEMLGDTDSNSDGMCDNSVGIDIDCEPMEGVTDRYSCTRDTYTEAIACQEGASTIQGCELDTTVGGANAECQEVPDPLSRGGDGSTKIQCMIDLTGTGFQAFNGDGLPTVDSDAPPDELTAEQETSEGTDEAGCDYTSSTQTSLVDVDGTVKTCTTVTTSYSGVSCPNDGDTNVSENCVTNYSDGSSTETNSNKTTDSTGTVTGDVSGTTNRTETKEAEEEAAQGTYSSPGDCGVGPPSCDGDVLQCAIVNEIYKSRCAFEDSLDGYSPDAGGDVVPIDEVDVEAEVDAVFSAPGFLSQSGCPPDASVSLFGQVFYFSYTPMCDALSAISGLFLGMILLWCTFIVLGAF